MSTDALCPRDGTLDLSQGLISGHVFECFVPKPDTVIYTAIIEMNVSLARHVCTPSG